MSVLRFIRPALLVSAAALIACGGGESACDPVGCATIPALASLTVTPTAESLDRGQTVMLIPTATASGSAVSVRIEFATANAAVATVSATGEVTAVSAGTTDVTVTATGSGAGFSTATKTVTATITVRPDALRGLTIAGGALRVGQTLQLRPTADTGGAGVSVTYAYTSDSSSIATVSSTGLVTAVAPGVATVSVVATGRGLGFTPTTKTAVATITVSVAPDAIRSLTVANGTVQMQQSLALRPVLDTAGMQVSVSYRYSSASPAIATVSNTGVVAGVAPGTALVTVEATGSGDGYTTVTRSAVATITVTPLPDAMRGLSVSGATLPIGQSVTLQPVPDTIGQRVSVTYTFASSAPSVASVSNVGLVTGESPGTANVVVTATASGTGYTTVSKSATAAITVSGSGSALGIGFGPEQFALIPAGTFRMGSTIANSDEGPVRDVTLSAFRMQRTEVTQQQFSAITRLAPSKFTSCGTTCPVETISLAQIDEFLTALNRLDPGKGYRLPTEAEWEYAARAGTTGDRNVPGAPIESLGWFGPNSQSKTWPVALKRPNAWGLYDIHGNVWERTSDRYGLYPAKADTNPTGPAVGAGRVFRGASWSITDSSLIRSAYRFPIAESSIGNFSSTVGFRLVRNVSTVTIGPVASVSLARSAISMPVGETHQLSAFAYDASGVVLAGRLVSWQSSNSAVATVTSAGLVTAIAPSAVPVTITATSEGRSTIARVTINPSTGLGLGFGDEQFALLPKGTFTMGSNFEDQFASFAHQVTLTKDFRLQRTEVTRAQWQAVMGSIQPEASACGRTCPVGLVSWYDVQRFLNRLNAIDPGKGYRLPTEAEWEYAARRGETSDALTADSVLFQQDGWITGNSDGHMWPVAQKRPNFSGLYDMRGNVSEWVFDWASSEFDFCCSRWRGRPRTDPMIDSLAALPSARVISLLNDHVYRGSNSRTAWFYSSSVKPWFVSGDFLGFQLGFRLARNP